MIETYNNIIFWIGYIVIASIMIVLIMASCYEIFQKLMNTKRFFIIVFNSAYEKKLQDIDEKDFYKWYEELEERYITIRNKEKRIKKWVKYNH